MKPEDAIADRKRPFTGAEYMQSLRDGREVYIDGERVKDVTAHPAFRNSVRSLARLYDALHDPKQRDDGGLVGRDRVEIAHRSDFGPRVAWLPGQL